jgi:hypothetical protein
MPETTSTFVQEGFDRVEDAYRSLDRRVQRLQKDLRSRRKAWEKQWTSGRKNLEKQVRTSRRSFEKHTRRQLADLRKNSIVKRAKALQKDTSRQIESRVGDVLGLFQIASKNDLTRIDRKLNQINRKLRQLEGGRRSRRTNGSATA